MTTTRNGELMLVGLDRSVVVCFREASVAQTAEGCHYGLSWNYLRAKRRSWEATLDHKAELGASMQLLFSILR